ncbi:cyclin L1 [Pseudohyphozyma bogoriensis]|nr:cyclin L1 [Pseudohyphozyma bogoriensis]
MASRHLLNPLAPLGEPTPSSLDGVPDELERDLRAYGAILIQQAGVMCEAPQSVVSTAQVLFQRFWFVTSLKHFGIRDIGLGALFLSSKLEESPLQIRAIINAYHYLQEYSTYINSPTTTSPSPPFRYTPMDYFATAFYDMKDALVVAEMQILKRLGFMTQVQGPYGVLVNYLQVLELVKEEEVVSRCWGFLNDLMQTPYPALYPPTLLATVAIYLSTRLCTPPIALPLSPVPWWELFDATEDDILDVSKGLLSLYKGWGGGLEPGKASEKVGESVWRRAKGLPVDKGGVRRLIIQAEAKSAAAVGNGERSAEGS